MHIEHGSVPKQPEQTDERPPELSHAALFLRFLRFGALAFGGPVAQIAMIRRELVEEEKWIGSASFNKLLAVMQVLPGPEAHELCVHLGIRAKGRIGGLLAGLGFMLPGVMPLRLPSSSSRALLRPGRWPMAKAPLEPQPWFARLHRVPLRFSGPGSRAVS